MSSLKGGGNTSAGNSNKGKKISDPGVDQLGNRVANISLDPQDDGGWEDVYGKKSKNKAGIAGKSSSQNPGPKAWGDPDVVQKLGLRSSDASKPAGSWRSWAPGSSRPSGGVNAASQASNQVAGGHQVSSVPVAPATSNHAPYPVEYPVVNGGDNDDNDDRDDGSDFDDEFDDDILSDEYDSDSSNKSHETRKKNHWFKELFECMDSLTGDEISDPERRWHCPACKGGPGAIDWYRGLQPLVNHAKTKGTIRVKLHRELAKLLDEDLRRRGTSAVPSGEHFGKWKGLNTVTEKEIIWPPMVIIMNTRLEKDMNDKWIGMGNQELVNSFSQYSPSRARHSYGPQGHKGMSVLIFNASAVGYLDAERLCKHFVDIGRDREAWDRLKKPLFCPGGNRPLYGYMAVKRDLEEFNQHSQGKQKLKYEMQSYIDKVVKELKQMSEDNQQLSWLRNKVAKEQMHSKALEESYGFLSEKLKKTEEENRVVRLRTKLYHEQSRQEMDYQEEFFKEQIQAMHDARVAREDNFEKSQQEKRDEVTQSPNLSSAGDSCNSVEEIQKFIKVQDKDMDEFVAERDLILQAHDENVLALKRRYWEETIALEKELDGQLNKLMQKYVPKN